MTEPKKRVLYVQYTNPGGYPPLDHSAHILAELNWEVLFLGITMPATRTLKLTPHPQIQVRHLPHAPPGWRQKIHYLYYLLWILWWVARWRPTWIYASDPMSAPVAWILTLLPGIKVLYHEHDSPDTNAPTSAFMRFILAARRRVAQQATVNVLPNGERGTLFQQQTGSNRPLYIVWNCPAQPEVPLPVSKPSTPLRLVYHGTIVPLRLPLTIIEAIAQVTAALELHIVGYETQGFIGYSQTLQAHAQQYGIGNRIFLHGTLATRADLLRQAQTCHIGLAFMPLASDDINLDTMAGASNKPFDYMACGLAILVTPLAAWENMYVANGYALACDPTDPTALAIALQWYADHPAEREQMGAAGRQQILDNWYYERQFAPLLPYFEKSVKPTLPYAPRHSQVKSDL